jgi:hypothetical protein
MNTIKVECPSCKGTGLYSGMGERDGAAVICHNCNGNGFINYEYNEFTGKKVKENVKRVFQSGYGYCISSEDITTKEGKQLNFSKYGCTYQEWLNGEKPKHIEDLYCPYIAYNKGMGNEPCKRCKEGSQGGLISNCIYFEDKSKCWEEYKK